MVVKGARAHRGRDALIQYFRVNLAAKTAEICQVHLEQNVKFHTVSSNDRFGASDRINRSSATPSVWIIIAQIHPYMLVNISI